MVREERRGEEPPEYRESLWMLVAAPAVWALHFLLSYGTAAIWCAKIVERVGLLDTVRLVVAGYTVVSLVLIGLVGLRGYRQHSFGNATVPHDFATAADRHRFLGFATLLLAGLSVVGVVFVALPVIFIGTCR